MSFFDKFCFNIFSFKKNIFFYHSHFVSAVCMMGLVLFCRESSQIISSIPNLQCLSLMYFIGYCFGQLIWAYYNKINGYIKSFKWFFLLNALVSIIVFFINQYCCYLALLLVANFLHGFFCSLSFVSISNFAVSVAYIKNNNSYYTKFMIFVNTVSLLLAGVLHHCVEIALKNIPVLIERKCFIYIFPTILISLLGLSFLKKIDINLIQNDLAKDGMYGSSYNISSDKTTILTKMLNGFTNIGFLGLLFILIVSLGNMTFISVVAPNYIVKIIESLLTFSKKQQVLLTLIESESIKQSMLGTLKCFMAIGLLIPLVIKLSYLTQILIATTVYSLIVIIIGFVLNFQINLPLFLMDHMLLTMKITCGIVGLTYTSHMSLFSYFQEIAKYPENFIISSSIINLIAMSTGSLMNAIICQNTFLQITLIAIPLTAPALLWILISFMSK